MSFSVNVTWSVNGNFGVSNSFVCRELLRKFAWYASVRVYDEVLDHLANYGRKKISLKSRYPSRWLRWDKIDANYSSMGSCSIQSNLEEIIISNQKRRILRNGWDCLDTLETSFPARIPVVVCQLKRSPKSTKHERQNHVLSRPRFGRS